MWVDRNKVRNFALDTNIVINLFQISSQQQINFVHQPARVNESIYHFYDLVTSDQQRFNFFITPETQSEISKGIKQYGHDPGIIDFINNSSIEPVVLKGSELNDANQLQSIYLGKSKKHNNHKVLAMFDKDDAADARILAEATSIDCMLLTDNFKHFEKVKDKIIIANNRLGFDYGIPYSTLSFFKVFLPECYDRKTDNFKEAPSSMLDLYSSQPELSEECSEFNYFTKYYEFHKALNIEDLNIGSPYEMDLPSETPEAPEL